MRWIPIALSLLPLACADSAAPASDSTGTDASSSGSETGEPPEPLTGVADLHLHMFAEEAFGGGWFHGSYAGAGDVALAPCDGGDPGDHGRFRDELAPLLGTCEERPIEEVAQMVPLVAAIVDGGGGLVGEFVSAVPGSEGDTGAHADRTGGWPALDGWPRWDAIAHQQVWEEQLYEAWQAGLRVEVISAVSLDWLCRALPDENVPHPECDEMADVKRQLELANEFDAAHDWVEIARTPEDARRIVAEGNLAFILSVEASHLMKDGDWRPQLDELYALGVRTLQPAHQIDSRFAGAAPHNTIFHVAQYAENCHIDTDCGLTTSEVTLGFDVDANCRNVLGLTADGQALVREMFDRGMLVDAAHLSEQAVRDLHAIAVEYDYYPLYISHGHFREIMIDEKAAEEKTTPAWVVEMLRETGGMFGLRTAHEEVDTYEPSPVDNSCHGSSRSFAQAYDYGRMGLHVAMGLGSDLNGFIQQTRPRFGPDACSASFPIEAQCQAKAERESGPAALGRAFDEIGLGHAGTLIDLLDDLDNLGSDATQLRSSADDFVRMWERATAERSGPIVLEEPQDLAGIVESPSHYQRQNEFPQECDEPYCPGGLLAGERCRFAAECESGVCAGAGECGSPQGTCE
jgi:microsomal dipeptidase-like Zn-dependent dipeptidase